MKTALALLLFLAGCGGKAPLGEPLTVGIRLPQALTGSPGRWRRFLDRVTHLEVEARTKAGREAKASAGPGEWAGLTLADLPFPQGPEDRLEIVARVWDKTRDGAPRTYPVLVGKTRVGAGETREAIQVRLTLRVSVREYD